MSNCLFCYKPLENGEKDFHQNCVRKFFGCHFLPSLDYTLEQLDELASQVIKEQTSLTGVQPKLSLHLHEHDGTQRLTIVGLWGAFIMKPQTKLFRQLPEIEDLTMHLAEIAKIEAVPHSLMRMVDGSLCYLTRRIDRTKQGDKIPMEDMCQLTERQTEYKYKSSYERIAKTIVQFSKMPKMDVTNYFEIVLFSWLTGNNDMHLKNFSLYEPSEGFVRLAPAYDLLNVVIANPKDDEELALTLNGRKKKLNKQDFLTAAKTMGIAENIVNGLIQKHIKLLPKYSQLINDSFLSNDLKQQYLSLLAERLQRL